MIFNQLSKSKNISWQKIKIGDSAEFKAKITQKEVESFIKLSGDNNPLHYRKPIANKKGFKKPIVHGMLLSSLFSTLVGVYLPGSNCLYLSQTLKFKRPIFTGEKITVLGKIKNKIKSVKVLYIETKILNYNNDLAITGEAIVKFL